MGYSKSKAAASWGISGDELKKRAREAGYKDTQTYYYAMGGSSYPVVKAIEKEMVKLDQQLDELTPMLSLSDEEKQAFLDKALQEITPYYEKKAKELEAGIQEGKVRTAEDILTEMRQVEEETKAQLQKFDLSTAETQEEFVNRLSDITSTKNETLEMKKADYQQRIENLTASQVIKGNLTSGTGMKEVKDELSRQKMEEQAIERSTASNIEAVELNKKYTLEQIQLARRAAEEERARRIGGTTEADLTKKNAMNTLGINDYSQLGSAEEIARRRTERGLSPIYDKNVLSNLEAEKIRARESTAQELQSDELARRNQEYTSQRDKILAERAKKASQLSTLRGY